MVKIKRKIALSFTKFSEEDYNLENVKNIISTIMGELIKNVYIVLTTHSFFKANRHHPKLKNNLVEPENFNDYKNNLVAIMDGIKFEDIGYNFLSKSKIKKVQQVSMIRDEYLELLKESVDLFNSAIAIIEFNEYLNKTVNTRDYVKFVNNNYSSMINNILKMAKITDAPSITNEKMGDGYKNFFEALADYLKNNIEIAKMLVERERIIRKEKEKIQKEITMIDEKRKAIHFEPDEKETLRLNIIKQANDKYEEFCLDFMRDLEKQVPLSTRDMYETFINEKFAKFQNQFNMPLDSSVSEGRAKEAIYQIDLMIDYISKISENSYVTSIYRD